MNDNIPTTAPTATIAFLVGALDSVVDNISTLLDVDGYPVLHADLEKGTLLVDASAEENEYSILMAAAEASRAVGLRDDELLYAELL
jgi:hypothetical protein